METLKKAMRSFKNICPATHWVLLWALRISCLIMICSFIVFVSLGGFDARGFSTYKGAAELFQLPSSVLLLASVLAIISENYLNRD